MFLALLRLCQTIKFINRKKVIIQRRVPRLFFVLLFFLVVATVISTNAVRRKLIAAGPWIDIGSGLFFIIAGIVLIISGGQNLLA